ASLRAEAEICFAGGELDGSFEIFAEFRVSREPGGQGHLIDVESGAIAGGLCRPLEEQPSPRERQQAQGCAAGGSSPSSFRSTHLVSSHYRGPRLRAKCLTTPGGIGLGPL